MLGRIMSLPRSTQAFVVGDQDAHRILLATRTPSRTSGQCSKASTPMQFRRRDPSAGAISKKNPPKRGFLWGAQPDQPLCGTCAIVDANYGHRDVGVQVLG